MVCFLNRPWAAYGTTTKGGTRAIPGLRSPPSAHSSSSTNRASRATKFRLVEQLLTQQHREIIVALGTP